MTSPLAYEKVWFEKFKYDEAERHYFEKLAKLLLSNGLTTHTAPKSATQTPHALLGEKQLRNTSPVNKQPNLIPTNRKSSTPLILSIQSQTEDEKSFKPKEVKEKRNKADKKGHDYSVLKDETKMDGIAALATNVNVEIVNRLSAVEKNNTDLRSMVGKLQALVNQLLGRVKKLERENIVQPTIAAASDPAPTKPAEADDEDDDGVDLFASESEDESEAVKKVREDLAASQKKSKKQELIQKSIIILDVKPWDDETDMKAMEEAVRKISTDGLLWGASKLVPLAYGIHKLQISCVVEDEKVSIDWLQETIEEIEQFVQSVDIAAFNKV